MGIARAIRRVKRQAKQGGLNAVISGLGEGLRSRAVPAPLRGAARKIASLIDPARAAAKSRRSSTHGGHAAHEPLPDLDPGVARPPVEVTPTGIDSGAEPSEPAEGTPVDAAAVGATPTYNATPLEVEPVDASPVEVVPLEVTPPVEITIEPSKPKPAAKKSAAKRPAAASTEREAGGPQKEKLAAADEPAKSVARSGSRTAKKRAGSRADTTSKKK